MRLSAAAALALGLFALSSPAQRPGAPGESARDTEVSIRYDQSEIDPGERARFEVMSTQDNIDYVTRTYALSGANAADLLPVISAAVAQENGRVDSLALGGDASIEPATGEVRIADAERTYLVVTAPTWMLPGIDQTVAALDQRGVSSWWDGTLEVYLSLEHRRPSEVAAFLESYATERAVLIPDDATNRLYIQDAPENLRAMVEAVRVFDAPAQAVMIEAELIEILRDDSQSLGLWWDAWKLTLPTEVAAELTLFRDRGRDADIDAEVTETGLTGVVSGLTDTFTRSRQITASFLFDNISPQAAAQFVNYLVNAGHARVLTAPRITVLQNERGVIQSLTEYPTLTLAQADGGERVLTDTEVTDGVVLEVRPFIGANTIRLDVVAQVTSLAGVSETQAPVITRREVQSQAVLRDGERLTLAGLTREQLVAESAGLPGLRHIPGLRHLFSRETEVRRTSDIVIFLTPRIVAPGGEYAGNARDNALREEARGDLAPLREE